MNVFVSGASGFIGRHLVHHLMIKGESVRCLVHREGIPGHLDCDTVRGDIIDYASVKSAIKGSDHLFHLAAALGSTSTRRKNLFKVNAFGTENVLKAAREEGVGKKSSISVLPVSWAESLREKKPQRTILFGPKLITTGVNPRGNG